MSARAAAIHARLRQSPAASDDRLLFSSAKTASPSSSSDPFDPKLVDSIRGEDYAALLRRNTEAYARINEERTAAFALAGRMSDSLAKRVGERNGAARQIEADLGALGDRLEREREKWREVGREVGAGA